MAARTTRGTRQPALRFRATILLTGRQRCAHLTFAGSGSGSNEAERVFRRIASAPSTLRTRQVAHWKRVLTNSTHVLTPNPHFNDAYRWALCARPVRRHHAARRQFCHGRVRVDRSGMDGGHAVSGRPGYAWYFGRDSVWMGLAFLAAGRHDIVKGILAFLRTHQESTGKILHEMTTSGHVHYDAADATPLYVLLLGRYLSATGDAAFVRTCYGSLGPRRRVLSCHRHRPRPSHREHQCRARMG